MSTYIELAYVHAKFYVCSIIFNRDLIGGLNQPPPRIFEDKNRQGQVGLNGEIQNLP